MKRGLNTGGVLLPDIAAVRPRFGLPPLFALVPSGLSIAEGLRAGLAIAAVVALGEWVHSPGLMNAALAAQLTCLCDAGGPVRQRLPALFTFGIFGTLVTAGFGLMRGGPLWVVVPCATLCVFINSFARVFGQAPMQVGNLLTVVLALALRAPLDTGQAAQLGAMFLAGNLWAVLLTMVIWRLHPFESTRRAIGEVFRLLSHLAADLRALAALSGTEEALWDRHARLHRRQVRDAIELARSVVLSTVRVRGAVSGRAAQSWIRLEAAEQIFGAMIALAALLAENPDIRRGERTAAMLRLLPPILGLLARIVVGDDRVRRPGLERAAAAVAAVTRAAENEADSTALARIGAVISEKLRIAVTFSGADALLDLPERDASERWRAVLRSNLRPGNEVLRHAVRAATAAAFAFSATLFWPRPYEHWLTITLVLTIQPYFALTVTRALERIGGTVLGGIFAAALSMVATTPLTMAAALFPLAVIALAVRGVSFGLFMLFLTPLVVLVSELGQPGSSEVHIALVRAGFTVGGGVLALLASVVLWPSWEPERVHAELRAAIRAHGRFAALEIASLTDDAQAAEVDAARRDAGVASNALEASLQRALLEPLPNRREALEAALTIDAALRRIAGRLSALQVASGPRAHLRAAWEPWRVWIERATETLADGGRVLPDRPGLPSDDPESDTLRRIAAQIDLIATAETRLPALTNIRLGY